MIGKTLGVYLAYRFAKIMLGMMLALFFLIVTVDFIEQLRKVLEGNDVPVSTIYLIAVLRAPVFLEKAFPFACLFAAMITLTQLNNKLELVVARAAGVSAWQFLLPLSICAALIGVIATTIYNPIAIQANEYSKTLIAEAFPGRIQGISASGNEVWIRQEVGEKQAVINAASYRENGKILDSVRIIEFDQEQNVIGRIEGSQAQYNSDHWLINNAVHTKEDGTQIKEATLKFPTSLSSDTILGAVSDPQLIPFWDLRETITKVIQSGANPGPFMVQYHSLTALPLFLVSMVIIAATVSLRFVRFGQSGRMILGGILSGFVLYTVANLVTSLGSNGIMPPMAAAWSPSVVAILFGMSVLLHQEDG